MRPKGLKNARSFLAIHKLEENGIDAILDGLKVIAEMDAVAEESLKAFREGRGYGEKSDAGPQYIANWVKLKSEKLAFYTKLASFIYPTLSAVGIKDIRKEEQSITERVVSAAEVRQTILDDPFAMSGPLPELTGGFTPESEKLNELREVRHSGSETGSGLPDGLKSKTTENDKDRS